MNVGMVSSRVFLPFVSDLNWTRLIFHLEESRYPFFHSCHLKMRSLSNEMKIREPYSSLFLTSFVCCHFFGDLYTPGSKGINLELVSILESNNGLCCPIQVFKPWEIVSITVGLDPCKDT